MTTRRQKVTFQGSQGTLAGLLESPLQPVRATVLFAHCFTCGKDIAAASRITRALANLGFATLRFDFTGLGSSDGDFANTNFSSNVQDLLAAADYLREQKLPPALLIGHSLGGTAALQAASAIPELRGVVTIGSPASAEHVARQFACDLQTIDDNGEAEVTLAGRPFTIRKQFIDDIRNMSNDHLARMRKALLILHSPVDSVVSIKEAEEIYRAAKHPKSFISLDKADHLLSRKADADYAAETISAWASRFLPDSTSDAQPVVATGRLRVQEIDGRFAQAVDSDSHHWIADEPRAVGGSNAGPDPYEHLLAALGTCTSMTVRMYADRKKWPLEKVTVQLAHTRQHGADCAACDEEHPQIDVIEREIALDGNLDDSQRKRLLEIADRCPVHRTLHNKLVVNTVEVTHTEDTAA
ncbi:MAG: bifunctional alpha/beta hydrolase/OsmC family protein [Gammaproteobacteria bacterium]|nr:bifunctional alpha/beta hydrolase/OsmC family protein [Gammaproteobacteria bacterium]